MSLRAHDWVNSGVLTVVTYQTILQRGGTLGAVGAIIRRLQISISGAINQLGAVGNEAACIAVQPSFTLDGVEVICVAAMGLWTHIV